MVFFTVSFPWLKGEGGYSHTAHRPATITLCVELGGLSIISKSLNQIKRKCKVMNINLLWVVNFSNERICELKNRVGVSSEKSKYSWPTPPYCPSHV
jgi:hypothetical protein